MCVQAHVLIAERTDYPLHVGITEAGTITSGNIKSAIGLGMILGQGIGDTIRVSLTGDPLEADSTYAGAAQGWDRSGVLPNLRTDADRFDWLGEPGGGYGGGYSS